MRKIIQFLCPAVAAALIVGGTVTSCNKPDNESPAATVFELEQDTVTVSASGGECSIAYTLEGAVEGASAQASSEADWLGDFLDNGEGSIAFNAAPNTGETAREAEVSVTYADISTAFTVIQEGKNEEENPPVEDAPFTITIQEIGATNVVASIKAEDQDMTYFFNGVGAQDLNTYPDDETFVKEYLSQYLTLLAEQNGMTVSQVLDILLIKGDQDRQEVIGLSAETEYYLFCVGMDNQMNILSGFVKEPFTTEPYAPFDAEIEVSVNGPDVTAVITPADDEIRYYATTVEGHGLSEDVMAAAAESALLTEAYSLMIWGMSAEQAIQACTLIGKDTVTFTNSTLKEETDYTLCAYSMDATGAVTSSAATVEFTTGATAMSDNRITVTFDQISSRRADYTVTPSNEDPYVFFSYLLTDELNAMSDDEIIAKICSEYYMPNWIRHGPIETFDDELTPETEYIVYAFGYSGQKATTELFKYPYTTKEIEYNDSRFEYEYGPYFNGTEVFSKFPELGDASGKAVMPATAKVTGDYSGVYHIMYKGDLTDRTVYPDEMMYYGILDDNPNTSWNMYVLYPATFGEVYTLFGFVETEDGNFSPLYRQLVGPFTEEGCSPIEEFNPYAAPQRNLCAPATFDMTGPAYTVIEPLTAPEPLDIMKGHTVHAYLLPMTKEDGSRISPVITR